MDGHFMEHNLPYLTLFTLFFLTQQKYETNLLNEKPLEGDVLAGSV